MKTSLVRLIRRLQRRWNLPRTMPRPPATREKAAARPRWLQMSVILITSQRARQQMAPVPLGIENLNKKRNLWMTLEMRDKMIT